MPLGPKSPTFFYKILFNECFMLEPKSLYVGEHPVELLLDVVMLLTLHLQGVIEDVSIVKGPQITENS
jgi:hypothetical protein